MLSDGQFIENRVYDDGENSSDSDSDSESTPDPSFSPYTKDVDVTKAALEAGLKALPLAYIETGEEEEGEQTFTVKNILSFVLTPNPNPLR